jgi:hypothetical protein
MARALHAEFERGALTILCKIVTIFWLKPLLEGLLGENKRLIGGCAVATPSPERQ